MAGSTSDVYDIFTRSPVSLKQLSAITVSIEVWRCKVNEYRNDGKLKEFTPFNEHVSLKTTMPDLPSMIYTAIDKYIRRFGSRLRNWLQEHHHRIFYFYRNYRYQNSVLKYFHDFVCDYTGAIDYVRTAGRMMRCRQVGAHQKFAIACTYFFEDDIRRIWPLVSSDMDLNKIDFSKSPQLYYWICCLRSEMDKIPLEWYSSIEELMLDKFMPNNRSSIEYFWNSVPLQDRTEQAIDIYFKCDASFFVRFMLPKLDELQLDEFINEHGMFEELMINGPLSKSWIDEELLLSVWLYVRNVMNVNTFTEVVLDMLQCEVEFQYSSENDNDDRFHLQNWLNLFCEIWTSAPEKLKRSAVRKITSGNRVPEDLILDRPNFFISANRKEFEFWSTFLSDATSEQRKRFWSNCWNELIKSTRCKDWQTIMKLCFENEDEMVKFKENVMANNEGLRRSCARLLIESCFDEVNDIVNFLWSEIQPARDFKQQLLQLLASFYGNVGLFHFDFMISCAGMEKFNTFIDDGFTSANVDVSRDFKNRLMSAPWMQSNLSRHALEVPIKQLVEFIDTFVSTKETLQQIKTVITNALKKKATADKSVLSGSSCTALLLWCLGSDKEVKKFKKNLRKMIRKT